LEETAQIVTEELAFEEGEHVRDRGHAGVGDVTATGDFGETVELAGVHHFPYLVRPKADYLDRTRLRVHEGAA
jgi:hypothetical protein